MITREQYVQTGKLLVQELNSLGRHRDWCSTRHGHYRAILPGYHTEDYSSSSSPGEFREDLVPEQEGGDYTALLTRVRRRCLFYVRNDTVSLEIANEIFGAAGLEPYEPSHRRIASGDMELTLTVTLPPGTSRVPENWDTPALQAWITAALAAYTPPEDAVFRPESVTVAVAWAGRLSVRNGDSVLPEDTENTKV